MSTEIIKFYASDGVVLNGYLNKCNKKTNKILIQTHGMTSNCFKEREMAITKEVEKLNIDSICFNNRGSDIVKYIKYNDGKKVLAGSAYENIEESYNDIIGAIKFAISLGYTEIYLQGHSLGATKIVYSYNKMKENNEDFIKYVKGILLLSLVDIPYIFRKYSSKEYVEYAEEREKENKQLELMPFESFIHPISVANYLRYTKYNENIDFAQYDLKQNDFKILNNIDVPIFMRWGDTKELIEKEAKELVELMNNAIKSDKKDINYIPGADHTYDEKEEQLAIEISEFIRNI